MTAMKPLHAIWVIELFNMMAADQGKYLILAKS